MFTGIIKSIGKVKKTEYKKGSMFLTIEKPKKWNIKKGDSICTNGTCLTVMKISPSTFTAELMEETQKVTSFGKEVPKYVNLEPSLKLKDKVDGHFVTGHVDTVGKIIGVTKKLSGVIYKISYPKKFNVYVAKKGSIAIDGISLTIVKAGDGWCTISLVDYSLKHTTLSEKVKGDIVNIEFDLIAKYLETLL